MWFGFGLVLVGVLLLLNNIGILKADAWGYIWPAAIIIVGLSILFKRKDSPKVESVGEKNETKKED